MSPSNILAKYLSGPGTEAGSDFQRHTAAQLSDVQMAGAAGWPNDWGLIANSQAVATGWDSTPHFDSSLVEWRLKPAPRAGDGARCWWQIRHYPPAGRAGRPLRRCFGGCGSTDRRTCHYFPQSAQSALAGIEPFLILSAPVFANTKEFDVCTSSVVALCFIAFYAETAAQPLAQCQIAAGQNGVSACKFASVAQLVEQQTLNLFVHGSSPCRGTTFHSPFVRLGLNFAAGA
jgi:hypothetical protein